MFAFGSSRAPWYMGGKPMKAAVGFADESSNISRYVVNTLVSFHLSPCSPASAKDPLLIRERCRAVDSEYCSSTQALSPFCRVSIRS